MKESHTPFRRVDNGNLIPIEGERQRFSEDLWDTIQGQILFGRTSMMKFIGRKLFTFVLPPPTQILDFTTITASKDASSIEVRFRFLENDAKGRASYEIGFTYQPPQQH